MDLRSLLSGSERRRLQIVEILNEQESWMSLTNLAQGLACSTRVLKDDLNYFKEYFKELSIETSYMGVRLSFDHNRGLRFLYQFFLKHSLSFRLLENIFVYKNKTAKELADQLFVSISTVYRLIDQINEALQAFDFQIESKPFRLVGSEKKIRYFFYLYYSEKHSPMDWPFETIDEEAIDSLLSFFIDFTQIPADFAYFSVFKLVSTINFVRFKNGYTVDLDFTESNFHEIIPNLSLHSTSFQFFEETESVKVDNQLVKELFTPYIEEEFAPNYERLKLLVEKEEKTRNEVRFLEDLLEDISEKNNIPILNKKAIVLAMHNCAHLEYQDPRSGFILYNHNKYFTDSIKEDFPYFYNQLLDGMRKYRRLLDRPLTDNGLYYFIYNLLTFWKNIVPELRRKFEKITMLIISDGHISHSRMIKDLIEYELNKQLVIDIYTDVHLSLDRLENMNYDIVISNFSIPHLQSGKNVYIENVPTHKDIGHIKKVIDTITASRVKKLTL